MVSNMVLALLVGVVTVQIPNLRELFLFRRFTAEEKKISVDRSTVAIEEALTLKLTVSCDYE